MILMTLGTHPQPMDRVVRAIDQLQRDHVIEEEVIYQSAVLRMVPCCGVTERLVPFPQLRRWVSEARVAVTHGGPGSIFLALALGKRPLVIPRDPRHGKHVDDHQVRFVSWLSERRPITPIWDMEQLAMVLRSAIGLEADAPMTGPGDAVLDRLHSILESA